MRKKSEESISSLQIYGQIITSAQQISNYFNNFFTSVAVKINKNTVKSKKKKNLSYLGHENSNTIFFSWTLPEDIKDLISSMKTSKASGPNSISIKSWNYSKRNFQNL